MTAMFCRMPKLLSYRRKWIYLIVAFASAGFLLFAAQVYGQSPDYENYDIFFNLLRSEGFQTLLEYRFELGFSTLSFMLTHLLASNMLVYGILVVCILLLKNWAIATYSPSPKIFIVVAAFYFARYFPLYELTQIRAAYAIGLTMLGAVFLWSRRLLPAVCFFATATMFHMSAFAIIPALLLKPQNRIRSVTIALLSFLFLAVATGIISTLLADIISVFEQYEKSGFGDERSNPLSATLLLDWAMIGFSLAAWSRISPLMKRIVFIQLIGMSIFYGAFDFPVIGHRLREFYSVFWIFFVADGLRFKNTAGPSAAFVFLSIIVYSYIFIFSGEFFH